MAEDQTPDTELRDLLLEHYEPAAPGAPGSKDKSTRDLYAILDDHAPGRFEVGDLYTVLKESGFTARLASDELVWTVRPRAS